MNEQAFNLLKKLAKYLQKELASNYNLLKKLKK